MAFEQKLMALPNNWWILINVKALDYLRRRDSIVTPQLSFGIENGKWKMENGELEISCVGCR